MNKRIKRSSIRRKLILVFAFSTSVVFFANIVMYFNINRSLSTIDRVYVSNIELNELLEALNNVQDYVYEYLNTKSTEALENYYRSEQNYQRLVNDLNGGILDDDMIIMQENIKNMSESYMKIIDSTVDAKRGRNIEKYKVDYENATTIYDYITTYINSLFNEQFKFNFSNYQLLLMSLHYLEVISTIALVIITMLNMIIIIFVTRSITDPLLKLTQAANRVSAGDFEVGIVDVESSDEVGIVTKAFNTMVVSIHQYITKVKESMEVESRMKEKELMMTNHLKDAQLKYLQAQINPHFLFNTLNAGAQLAMMEEADKTCLFIENMADFFRFNMKSFNQDSTIRDEIKQVDSYIYILNVRFSGGIHFYKKIDTTILDVRVPSMILQPVVENAVNYGIRNIEYEGNIKLSVYQEEEYINLTIADNGVGMDQDTIDKVMHQKIEDNTVPFERTLPKDSNGIGLGNVINRLKLYYDREDVFEINSEGPNQGTKVTIHIPIITGTRFES